ncbi:ankyrin repeat domain protein [Nitzschia inconspicua]|uniref:Ankyrin repeat domain protein n=1 Tax=Nitzschia inconspicua TaxID=303405 RepID=A0A9K3Q011_9STRA|nr:ankyrin repeat domain protein [Nitzschia inconspicua]
MTAVMDSSRKRKVSSSSAAVSPLDAWSRVAATATVCDDHHSGILRTSATTTATAVSSKTATQGRGSLTGWTLCPLCGEYSKKKYAVGRGLASHLRDIHTPWQPSKMAQKIHRRSYDALQRRHVKRQRQDTEADGSHTSNLLLTETSSTFEPLQAWTPSEEEVNAWNIQMLDILRSVEQTSAATSTESVAVGSYTSDKNLPNGAAIKLKNIPTAYRESLPPFLKAAAEGHLETLRDMVQQVANSQLDKDAVLVLLNTRDRHSSTAEHWAAGGGHLECLRFLHQTRTSIDNLTENASSTDSMTRRKVRRRDGKTSLHYAARNGHIPCINYILKETECWVDEPSGDGTTPLHMACYGGQYDTVKFLVEDCGASPLKKNDWGCSCAHFTAMTIAASYGNEESIRKLCSFLSHDHGVSFVSKQGQGHTSLHKAAHRGNKIIIRWMADKKEDGGAGLSGEDKLQAGAPDLGGHKPSDIWRSMGHDDEFGTWIKSTMGW